MKKVALVFGLVIGSFFTFAEETKLLASGAHWKFTAIIEADTTFQLIETKKNQADNVILTMNKQDLNESINQSLSVETFADNNESVIDHKRAKQMRQAMNAFETNQLPSDGFEFGLSKSGEAVLTGTVITVAGTGVAVVVAAPAVAVVAGVWGFVHVVTHI